MSPVSKLIDSVGPGAAGPAPSSAGNSESSSWMAASCGWLCPRIISGSPALPVLSLRVRMSTWEEHKPFLKASFA